MEIPQDHPIRDLKVFIRLVWKFLRLPEPTPVQLDICDWLQYGPARSGVLAYRGAGKSWITSVFVLHCILLDLNFKALVVSASKDRADAFSTFTMRLIMEMEILQHLIPRADQRNSRIAFDVNGAEPDHSPSVKSVGIFGQMTGSRADLIVADDVEVANNSDTELKRVKLSESVKEFDAILKPAVKNTKGEIIRPGGRIRYLGTPQSEESLYNALPTRGYTFRIWPARFPNQAQLDNYGDQIAPMILEAVESTPFSGESGTSPEASSEAPRIDDLSETASDSSESSGASDGPPTPSEKPSSSFSLRKSVVGTPTDPLRFDEKDLQEREASYGRSGFALQFQLDTSLADAERYPLKLADLIVTGLNPDVAPERLVWSDNPANQIKELANPGFNGDKWFRPEAVLGDWIPYQGTIMAVDPSGRGADELGYAVVSFLNGFLYVQKVSGIFGIGYGDKALEEIAMVARDSKVDRIIIEANFGDGMFQKLLTPVLNRVYPCVTEEVKHSVQKENRIIDTLEPVMNQHRLVINRKVVEEDRKVREGMSREKAQRLQLFHQMTRICRERGALAHDDRLDALSIAVAHWTSGMAVTAQDAIEDRKQELLEKEIQRLDALGQWGPGDDGWRPKTRGWLPHRGTPL